MGQMTKQDQSINSRGTDVLKPRLLGVPEPGKYLLGGNPSLVRNINDYNAMLKQIPKTLMKHPADFGRRLCGLLMRQEFSKEELATKNVTGVSRHLNRHTFPIEKLDPVIMDAIFEQAQYQFPDVDFMTDEGTRRKIITYLNDICKHARRDKRDELKIMST